MNDKTPDTPNLDDLLKLASPLAPGQQVHIRPYVKQSSTGKSVFVHQSTRGAVGGKQQPAASNLPGRLKTAITQAQAAAAEKIAAQTAAKALAAQAAELKRSQAAQAKSQAAVTAAKQASVAKAAKKPGTSAASAMTPAQRQALAQQRAKTAQQNAQTAQQNAQKRAAAAKQPKAAKKPAAAKAPAATKTPKLGGNLAKGLMGANLLRGGRGLGGGGGRGNGFRHVAYLLKGGAAGRAVRGAHSTHPSAAKGKTHSEKAPVSKAPSSHVISAKELAAARKAIKAAELYRHAKGVRGLHRAGKGYHEKLALSAPEVSFDEIVMDLQVALAREGWDKVSPTGQMDDATLGALDEYLAECEGE